MEKSAIQILLRSSLFSYAATAVFLLLLAFGMYRFQWGEKEITLKIHLPSRIRVLLSSAFPRIWFCA